MSWDCLFGHHSLDFFECILLFGFPFEWCSFACQFGQRGQNVASTFPHVSVAIDHAQEMSQLANVTGCLNSLDRFHFLWLWLDSCSGHLVTQALNGALSPEALSNVRSKVGVLKSGWHFMHFFWMIFECAIADNENVIDACACTLEISHHVAHDLLKHVWAVFDSHG